MLALAAILATTFVGAGSASAASELDVTVGYGGYVLPGRAFPVAVSVTTDRLVQGQLEASVRSGFGDGENVSVSMPVEVPGGGAKRYLLTLPGTTVFQGAPMEVDVSLLEGGDVVARSAGRPVRIADDRELVGLLPGATPREGLPAPVSLAVEGGVATFFAVGAAELDQAPASLGPLGSIAVGADELGQLAPAVQRRVLAWLEHGGTLLVGAPPGTTVAGLPDAWQPGPSGNGTAVLGRVRLVGDRIATGRWADLVYPSPAPVAVDGRFGPFGMPQSVGGSLGADAGLRVPRLGWLLLFLLAYAVIVGPITAIVLNRSGRAELAWVVIPAVAIVFTAGTWAIAQGLRSSAGLAHAAIVETSPAGARSSTFVGIAARGRTDARLSIAEGTWTARQFNGGDGGFGAGIGRTAVGGSGPEAVLRLAAGQFAVAQLTGPAPDVGTLEVTADSSADGQASGLVRNATEVRLEEVAVFVGSTATEVGALEPGEERPWRIEGAAGLDRNLMFELVDARTWEQASGVRGGFDDDSPVNYPAWVGGTPLSGSSRPAGMAVAVGWTRDHRPGVEVNGGSRETKGRAAFVATAPVTPTGTITDMTVRGEPVRGAFGGGGFMDGAGSLGSMLRLVLPDGAAPTGQLVARLPLAGRVEVWNGRTWEIAADTDPAELGQDPLGGLDVPVPSNAVVDGQVFLRITNVGGPLITGNITLSERR